MGIEPELPFDDHSSAEDQIDVRCDAFEAAWRNGNCPQIGDFIQSEVGTDRKKLFRELLLVDAEWRRSLGERPTPEYYLRLYPEFASEVQSVSLLHGATVFATVTDNSGGALRAESKQPHSHIAHFKLVERLGEGAMGEAWKAWDTRVKRHVTIKFPHRSLLSENDLRRFLREVEAAGQLNHPQLAAVHSIEKIHDTFFIVAAFVEGDNLREYASQKRLQESEIVSICAGIGEAVQHAHDVGIVHRDLKPANIIIDPSGLPHIIDFGLAKVLDAEHDLTLNGELLGTPAYMSPELARGDSANADARSDVYSVGLILYELLCGRCPFAGSRGYVINQILTCEPPPPRSLRTSIPRDLETICRKAIEKAPANRYATAAAMADDLRRFAAGLPIRSRRVGILEKSWRWICRHPAKVASVLIVASTLLAVSARITELQDQNKFLAGIRPVRITTSPSGAHVAIVPINPKTNEPDLNPAGIVKPTNVTPLTIDLKSGTYLVEAVVSGENGPNCAEVYRTVSNARDLTDSIIRDNKERGVAPDMCFFSTITIRPLRDIVQKMVRVKIPEDIRKQNPVLPVELFVDATQTTPADFKSHKIFNRRLHVSASGEECITYPVAILWAEASRKRLPSAMEYDAIIAAVERGEARSVQTGEPVSIKDIFDDYPEWTTTIRMYPNIDGDRALRRLHEMHVLKGCKLSKELGDTYQRIDDSLLGEVDDRLPKTSIRGVRSATPRFVMP